MHTLDVHFSDAHPEKFPGFTLSDVLIEIVRIKQCVFGALQLFSSAKTHIVLSVQAHTSETLEDSSRVPCRNPHRREQSGQWCRGWVAS